MNPFHIQLEKAINFIAVIQYTSTIIKQKLFQNLTFRPFNLETINTIINF